MHRTEISLLLDSRCARYLRVYAAPCPRVHAHVCIAYLVLDGGVSRHTYSRDGIGGFAVRASVQTPCTYARV